MPTIAPIQRVHHGSQFRAYRLRGDASLISPIIGVDHYWMSAPTFPPHPHAGISAVSYLLLDSETGIVNCDSIGTHNLIRPGGLQWTTAGRGLVHEEVPAETGKTVHGLQIFVALTPARRDIAPFPLTLESHDVPLVQLPGIKVRIPVGSFAEAHSPLNQPTEVTMLVISMEQGDELDVPIAAGDSAFFMPIFGKAMVDGQNFDHNDLKLPVFPAQNTSHAISLRSPRGSAKVMPFAGSPLHFTAT
ncbi:pirin family protein [Paraburkholderia adhaesiva]|uniref:pirin family protein n=1 Tax=Paraburkholderia adhaesiva TaxID=2883244 RepID=UPI001F2CBAF2|nr:pirin family protein [Paraburkholderia adhaesiva]